MSPGDTPYDIESIGVLLAIFAVLGVIVWRSRSLLLRAVGLGGLVFMVLVAQRMTELAP